MTQTVPDISPLMPMHQDPLLVQYVPKTNQPTNQTQAPQHAYFLNTGITQVAEILIPRGRQEPVNIAHTVVSTMAVDTLATQSARVLAAIVLTLFFPNIPILASETVNYTKRFVLIILYFGVCGKFGKILITETNMSFWRNCHGLSRKFSAFIPFYSYRRVYI